MDDEGDHDVLDGFSELGDELEVPTDSAGKAGWQIDDAQGDNHFHDELDDELEAAKVPTDSTKAGRPFPKHISNVLESMYNRGMTGWGSKHSEAVDEALESTGLNIEQLKVF